MKGKGSPTSKRPLTKAGGLPHPVLNGSFPVESANTTTIVIKLPWITAAVDTPDVSGAYMGAQFQGPTALGNTGGVVEGNAVYDSPYPLYQDTGSTGSAVVRNNYYYGGNYMFLTNFSGGGLGTRVLTAISKPLPARIRIDTNTNEIQVGDVILVDNVAPALCAGVYTVSAVSSTFIEYDLPAAVSTPSLEVGPVYLPLHQTNRLSYENNTLSLFSRIISNFSESRGLISNTLADNTSNPPAPILSSWVLRDNIFGYVFNATTDPGDRGVFLSGLVGCIVEDNPIDMARSQSIYFSRATDVQSLDNRKPDGQWVPTWVESPGTAGYRDDVVSEIDDVLCLAF